MSEPRHISPEGIALVKHFEGWFDRAYLCPAGVWTIGYGHTGLTHNDGTVYRGRKITPTQGEALLRHDMLTFERRVQDRVTVPLAQHEFDALVSFAFNVGGRAFATSTLLRLLNAGDREGAAAQFHRWVRGGGVRLPGLVRRRRAEAAMFLGQDWRQAAAEEED